MKLEKYHCTLWVHLQILFVLIVFCDHVKAVESSRSSCGGTLMTSAGTLEFVPDKTPQLCVWVIKLPVPSTIVQFRLQELPPSSQLSLYTQRGHVPGQFTIRSKAHLTSPNISSTVTMESSNMVVVWAPSAGFDSESSSQLTFKWEAIQGQGQDLDLVDGVGYVEGEEGKFSWEKAGEGQQTLLWVLNSQDSGESVDLTTKTDFKSCDLVDFCLCSYLGVYQVYDNFLQAVTTDCGRSSTKSFEKLQPVLVVFGFVDPKYQSDRNSVSLTWKSGSKNETTAKNITDQSNSENSKFCSTGRPKSCSEIQSERPEFNSSRNCMIYPFGIEGEIVEAFCDFETDGGGWTTIQKRSSGPKEEFYRNWAEYENGFGSVDGNFWLGLKAIHALTKDWAKELRIDLWDFEEGQAHAKYSTFSVSDSSDFYRLSIDGYSGTAGDSFMPSKSHQKLNGMRFSTKDKDNDGSGRHCAEVWRAAWWYNDCSAAELNGLYYNQGEIPDPKDSGMAWHSWKNAYIPLWKVEMKIRQRREDFNVY